MQAITALAVAHHGEILQGVFSDAAGQLHRGLVTLPFIPRYAIANVKWSNKKKAHIYPNTKKKALEAVKLLCADLGYSGSGFTITIKSNIPEGFGLGSSTADIVAALRGVGRFHGIPLKAAELFRLAVRAESASDGTMFPGRARLVCQREGEVLQRFARRLPSFSLISFNAAPQEPVDTLDYQPAYYSSDEIAEFDELRNLVGRGIKNQDIAMIGEVATRSAIINNRYLPQPNFDTILDIAHSSGALGIQVAHSGRMIGIMMPKNANRSSDAVESIIGQLNELLFLPEFHPAVAL